VLLHAKGGDIPRILERLRDKISESRDIRRELEAMTAQSRASGYLVSALPGVFLLLQASTNPRSVSPLLLTPLGNLLGALALGMNLAGFLAVRRIVDLERA
jgi:tight adherence protein B